MKKMLLMSTIVLMGATGWSADQNTLQEANNVSTMALSTDAMSLEMGISQETWDHNGHQMPQACQDVKLTDAQKQAIHMAMFDAQRAAVQLQANLKMSGMDYMKNLVAPEGNADQADKLGTDLSGNVAALVKNKLDFQNKVFFSILSPEQRHPALICEMMMRKMMMHKKLAKMCQDMHHGHGGHDGDHNGGGDHKPNPGN